MQLHSNTDSSVLLGCATVCQLIAVRGVVMLAPSNPSPGDWSSARPALTLGTWAHSHIALASFLCHGHPSRLAPILGHEGWRQLFPPSPHHPHAIGAWTSPNMEVLSSTSQAGALSTDRCCSHSVCLTQTHQTSPTSSWHLGAMSVSFPTPASPTLGWFRPVSGWGRRVWAGTLGDCLNGGYTFLTWPLQFLCCIFVFEAY